MGKKIPGHIISFRIWISLCVIASIVSHCFAAAPSLLTGLATVFKAWLVSLSPPRAPGGCSDDPCPAQVKHNSSLCTCNYCLCWLLLCHCDEIPDKSNLREEEFILLIVPVPHGRGRAWQADKCTS
jgi:hypothetical protein